MIEILDAYLNDLEEQYGVIFEILLNGRYATYGLQLFYQEEAIRLMRLFGEHP